MKKLVIVSAIALAISGSVMADDVLNGSATPEVDEAGQLVRINLVGVANEDESQREVLAKLNAFEHACGFVYTSKVSSSSKSSVNTNTVSQNAKRDTNKNKSSGSTTEADDFIDGKVNADNGNGTSTETAAKKSDYSVTKKDVANAMSSACSGKLKFRATGSTVRDGKFVSTFVWDAAEVKSIQAMVKTGGMD